VLSVKNKEMTEAEAMGRYAEYKTTMLTGISGLFRKKLHAYTAQQKFELLPRPR
jgi:hypothetical protein